MLKTNVLIVGAGINGVLTALFLHDNGVRDLVVIDKNYPGSGGTFRCATGIRVSFTSYEHVEAMKRSIELWKTLSDRFRFEYRRDGYLWLITREEDYQTFRKIVDFHRSLGVPTRIIGVEEVKEIVPSISINGLLAGVYDPLAGKADNFASLINILSYLSRSGVSIHYPCEAKRMVASGSRVKLVETNRGLIEAEKIVITAGWDSPALLSTIGVEAPVENVPKHALITEAFRYTIKPLIIDWSKSSYLVQVFHGNILIGAEVESKPGEEARNIIEYPYVAMSIWRKWFPWLSNVSVLRYWTGYYDVTPDHHPIVGPIDDYENVYLAIGFSGHGFMMAPAVAEALTQYIIEGRVKLNVFNNLRLDRFKKGKLIREIAVFG